MNRSADPPQPPLPQPSYPVPWHVDRRDRTHPMVTNRGATVQFARVFARTSRAPGRTLMWGHVEHGEQMEVCLCDTDVDDVVVTLAWFRPEDGHEYIWRFVV
ncbi:hypothetical protein ACTJI8_16450 [Microbacterium sp. 22303]|uniref:hypothetical protein n=1 Tax=Microbacterium sp. 22303 TaxID=3453905 RepID=UPI003F84E7B1